MIALAIYAVVMYLATLASISADYAILAATAIVAVMTVVLRPKAKALVLISAACVVYGYLMKPLGLVAATAALVYISAYGGHEFKWKEVTILFVVADPVFRPGVREGIDAAFPDLPGVHGKLPDPLARPPWTSSTT